MDLLAILTRFWSGKPSAPVVSPVVRQAVTAPMTEHQQWQRVSAVMGRIIGGAEKINALQKSTSQQLDAASYALDILRTELTAAMPFTTLQAAASAVVPVARPLRTEVRRTQLAA